jgi:hypothetical protein
MGSMGYCLIENTQPELERCLDKFRDCDFEEWSDYELKAAKRMIKTLKEVDTERLDILFGLIEAEQKDRREDEDGE